MWAIQKNLSTGKFELTQDGFTILELNLAEVDQIGRAIFNGTSIRPNPAGYKTVKNV